MNKKNNKQLFDLNEYVKVKRNFFNNENKCLAMSKKYFQTNPKSKLFNQMYYTASDYSDFDKYGFLNFMYYFSISFSEKDNKISFSKKDNKNKNKNKNKNNKNNDLIKLYNDIDYNSVKNTFEYIFYKFKKGVFIIIEDNKLRTYLPFSNAKFENDYLAQTYLNEEEKNDIDTIVSFTNINNKLRIPNTRRSKLEQKLNKFQVLRGSIIAGNDNENLLREFRMLLVELNAEGYISKKETSDILLQMLKMNI